MLKIGPWWKIDWGPLVYSNKNHSNKRSLAAVVSCIYTNEAVEKPSLKQHKIKAKLLYSTSHM